MDAGGAGGGETDQNIPSLLAMGPPAEHHQLPLQSPLVVSCSQVPIKNTPGTKQCPALTWLQEPWREPSEVPGPEQGPSTGKASPYPSPCSAPRAGDSLAQRCPPPSRILRVHGDPTQGKPTKFRHQTSIWGDAECSAQGSTALHRRNTTKMTRLSKPHWQTQHSFTKVPEDPFYQNSSSCFTSFSETHPQVSEINKGKGYSFVCSVFYAAATRSSPGIIFPPRRQVRWKPSPLGTGQ